VVALAALNDVVTREAFARGRALIDLRPRAAAFKTDLRRARLCLP
jgi:hypothetical protein